MSSKDDEPFLRMYKASHNNDYLANTKIYFSIQMFLAWKDIIHWHKKGKFYEEYSTSQRIWILELNFN